MLNLIRIFTNTCGHNADREGYITLWTNYQYITNKRACINALHILEFFDFFFQIDKDSATWLRSLHNVL